MILNYEKFCEGNNSNTLAKNSFEQELINIVSKVSVSDVNSNPLVFEYEISEELDQWLYDNSILKYLYMRVLIKTSKFPKFFSKLKYVKILHFDSEFNWDENKYLPESVDRIALYNVNTNTVKITVNVSGIVISNSTIQELDIEYPLGELVVSNSTIRNAELYKVNEIHFENMSMVDFKWINLQNTNLKMLSLSDNKLSSFDNNFDHIKELNIDISETPTILNGFDNINKISINNTKITDFSSLSASVSSVNITNNEISKINYFDNVKYSFILITNDTFGSFSEMDKPIFDIIFPHSRLNEIIRGIASSLKVEYKEIFNILKSGDYDDYPYDELKQLIVSLL